MVTKQLLVGILAKRLGAFSKESMINPFHIRVKSIDRYYAKITSEFCRDVLKRLGCTVSIGKEPIKVQRWTVLSSPFAHKTARTQFEKRTFGYMIKYLGIDKEGSEIIKWYVSRNAPSTVQIS